MVNYAKLKSKLIKTIFSLLNNKCQVIFYHKLILIYLKIVRTKFDVLILSPT